MYKSLQTGRAEVPSSSPAPLLTQVTPQALAAMVLVSFQRILVAVVLSAFTNILGVLAAPAGWEKLDHEAREILARATPAAPHWVVYGDKYTSGTTGPPAPSAIDVRIILVSRVSPS